MDPDLERWLADKNAELEREGVPAMERPLQAISAYSEEKRISIAFGSGLACSIFGWFEGMARPGAHTVGSMFVGAYYYQGCFWPVSIPVVYGRIPIDAFESLRAEMTAPVMQTIRGSPQDMERYLFAWADCVDWSYGHADLHAGSSTSAQFLRAANDELNGASTTLLGSQTRNAAYQQARMAAEKSLKALLAAKDDLSEQDLRKSFKHDLVKLAKAAQNQATQPEIGRSVDQLGRMKSVGDRYTGRTIPHAELWDAYRLCLRVSAAVIRELCGRGIRKLVQAQLAEAHDH